MATDAQSWRYRSRSVRAHVLDHTLRERVCGGDSVWGVVECGVWRRLWWWSVAAVMVVECGCVWWSVDCGGGSGGGGGSAVVCLIHIGVNPGQLSLRPGPSSLRCSEGSKHPTLVDSERAVC